MERATLDRLGGRAGPAIALVTVVPTVLDQASVDSSRAAWLLVAAWAPATVIVASFLVTRPVLAACGSFVLLGAAEIWASTNEVELSFVDLLPVAVCLFAVGTLAGTRAIVVTTGVVVAGSVGGTVVNRLTADPEWRGGVDIVAGVLSMLLALVAGLALRSYRARVVATEQALLLERRSRELAEEAAAAHERARLARELHDIVAHSVTLLVVNAETIRARRGELPAWVGTQADAMADAGRRATDEMRALLAVLRDEVTDASTRPDLPALVAEARRSGTPVELTVLGTPGPLSPEGELALYRVVQEGLSNARRHAPGADVAVTVGWGESEVVVRVVAEHAATHLPTGTGTGLRGLTDRVAELGGTLRSGHADGRHVLTATLPHSDGHVR